MPENIGTMLYRNIYHYWYHIGEAHAIRQSGAKVVALAISQASAHLVERFLGCCVITNLRKSEFAQGTAL